MGKSTVILKYSDPWLYKKLLLQSYHDYLPSQIIYFERQNTRLGEVNKNWIQTFVNFPFPCFKTPRKKQKIKKNYSLKGKSTLILAKKKKSFIPYSINEITNFHKKIIHTNDALLHLT